MNFYAFARKGNWLGWLLIAGLLAWFIGIRTVSPEPYYQGKSLSEWAKVLPDEGMPAPEMRAAIMHFGPQAIPLAVALCQTKDSYFREKLIEWSWAWNRQFDHWQIRLEEDSDAQARGVTIFQVLGPVGAPAIPKLVKLLETDDDGVWQAAGSALGYMGTNTVPPLIALLAHPRPAVRMRAVAVLGNREPMAHMAKPELLRCLADPDSEVRGQAAYALGWVRDDPAVIAALLRCLRDPKFGRNDYAAAALGYITKEPEVVVPALLDYLAAHTNEFSPSIQVALNHYGTNAQPWAPRLAAMIQSGQFNPFYTRMLLSTLSRMDSNLAAPMIAAWEQAHPPPPSPPPPPDDDRRGHLPPPPPPSSPTPRRRETVLPSGCFERLIVIPSQSFRDRMTANGYPPHQR